MMAMFRYALGLLIHPSTTLPELKAWDDDRIMLLAQSHVLPLAAIPVIFSMIGTTLFGWDFGNAVIRISPTTAIFLGILFYLVILACVMLIGYIIYRMAHHGPRQPSLQRCIAFAGYIATPMFISGVVAVYPLIWLCCLAGIAGILYTSYLLYVGIPHFLELNKEEAFTIASSILAIGVLVLEALALVLVLVWRYGISMVP
jgi:hypothetical protein